MANAACSVFRALHAGKKAKGCKCSLQKTIYIFAAKFFLFFFLLHLKLAHGLAGMSGSLVDSHDPRTPVSLMNVQHPLPPLLLNAAHIMTI